MLGAAVSATVASDIVRMSLFYVDFPNKEASSFDTFCHLPRSELLDIVVGKTVSQSEHKRQELAEQQTQYLLAFAPNLESFFFKVVPV